MDLIAVQRQAITDALRAQLWSGAAAPEVPTDPRSAFVAMMSFA